MKNKSIHENSINRLHKQFGVSLVELAVVLGIVGFLAAGSMSMFSEQRVHVQWMESSSKLALAKASLLQFARRNNFLPCPDTGGDGIEDRVGITCESDRGMLPFVDLGLSAVQVRDSWDNPFLYATSKTADVTANITNCPIDSACFFNNSAPPMFDLTTLPTMGNPGGDNLKVCTDLPCDAATAGVTVNSEELIAVLLAFNENGDQVPVAGTAEAMNATDNHFFVQATYSKAPFFDDHIQTISANELKNRYESEVIELVNATIPNAILGGAISTLGQNKDTGGSGDNIQSNPIEAWDYNTQNFDFGVDNANKEITISFKAEIVGGWEDGSVSNHTRDSFVVGINGSTPGESGAINNDDYNALGMEVLGDYSYYDPTNNNNTGYKNYDAWTEYLEYNVKLNENGEVDLNLIVGSTHETEVVNVSDISAVLYEPPSSAPYMPTVNTAGINLEEDDQYILDVFK